MDSEETNEGSREVIERLEGEGRLDSSGRFTLDPKRARELLREKLTIEPHTFALCLVAAAIGQDADTISVHVDATRFDMHFDGAPYALGQLEWLSGVDLDLSRTGHSYPRDLFYGLHAAWALAPRQITVESRGAGPREGMASGYRLTMNAQGTEVEASERLSVGNRVLVELPKGLLPSSRYRNLQNEVLATLRERCRWIRAGLLVNGRHVGEIWQPEPCLAWLPLERTLPAVHGVVALEAADKRLHLVVDGVAFPYPGEMEFPISGVVYCDGLIKDLTQASLVIDDAVKELDRWVRGEARHLVRSLYVDWESLDEERREAALPHLDKLAELDSRGGNLAAAQSIYQRLLVMRAQRLEPTATDLLLNLSNLATLHSLQNRGEEALKIFLDIADDLQKAKRLEEASTYFVRAMSLEGRVGPEHDALLLSGLVGWAECLRLAQPSVAVGIANQAYRRLERIAARLPQAEALRPRLESLLRGQPLGGLGPDGGGSVCLRCGSCRLVPFAVEIKSVQAMACGSCGNVELTAPHFDQLWTEHLESRP